MANNRIKEKIVGVLLRDATDKELLAECLKRQGKEPNPDNMDKYRLFLIDKPTHNILLSMKYNKTKTGGIKFKINDWEAFYKRLEKDGHKHYRQVFKDLERGGDHLLIFSFSEFDEWIKDDDDLKEQLRPNRVLIIFGKLSEAVNNTGGRSFAVYRLALMPENIVEIKDEKQGEIKFKVE
ncbi:11208_t:CDS:2 [Ambispora gerdemannii]|uniref:11208_t:CDS:1 n=1 Tax=Ambispora gerdemannii TaxID=144530 RepID=A0A9N8W0D0_9GLOM|nr:11208_t:CDS:2 [Ambispora gerdemannii]